MKIQEKKNNLQMIKRSRKANFNKGDFVVYPSYGLGKINGIQNELIGGKRIKVFVISINERVILRVSADKIQDLGLRKLSSKDRMKDAFAILKGKSKKKKKTMWSRRAQEYETKILSGDPVLIAEVLKELYKKDDFDDSSFSEKQIYSSALDRLARELAAMQKLDKETATKKLEEILSEAA